jgi:hypothetical protein
MASNTTSKCKWCGRTVQGNINYDQEFLGHHGYCSKKCKAEAEAQRAAGRGKAGCMVLVGFMLVVTVGSILLFA